MADTTTTQSLEDILGVSEQGLIEEERRAFEAELAYQREQDRIEAEMDDLGY